MKKNWIEYSDSWKNVPMAFWVHRILDEKSFIDAAAYDPPAPKPNSKGEYKIYHIEFNGITLRFSSIYQFDEFIRVMSKKVLPRSLDLSRIRCDNYGPNRHWLSRLPSKAKAWKIREQMTKYLCSIKNDLFLG